MKKFLTKLKNNKPFLVGLIPALIIISLYLLDILLAGISYPNEVVNVLSMLGLGFIGILIYYIIKFYQKSFKK